MDPQIIIPALSCSFISDSVRVFNWPPKTSSLVCFWRKMLHLPFPARPVLSVSLLASFWTLPALCSSPGQEEWLWSIVACYFTEEAAALPSQLSLFITSTQTGLQEQDEEMLQYTTKEIWKLYGPLEEPVCVHGECFEARLRSQGEGFHGNQTTSRER